MAGEQGLGKHPKLGSRTPWTVKDTACQAPNELVKDGVLSVESSRSTLM